MPELRDHRTWLASFCLSLAALTVPAYFGMYVLRPGWFIAFYLGLWMWALVSFIGLIRADMRLAQAVDVSPWAPLLTHLLGFGLIVFICLDWQAIRRSRRGH